MHKGDATFRVTLFSLEVLQGSVFPRMVIHQQVVNYTEKLEFSHLCNGARDSSHFLGAMDQDRLGYKWWLNAVPKAAGASGFSRWLAWDLKPKGHQQSIKKHSSGRAYVNEISQILTPVPDSLKVCLKRA